MKRFLSILLTTAIVCTLAFSTAYADSGKSQSGSSTIATYKSNMKTLKEQLKKYRKDQVKKAKLLKEIAREKKKNNDNSFTIIVNGTEVTTSTQSVIRNGKALLPVRPVIKALGASLVWNQTAKTIVITKGDIKITLTIGSNIAIVNNTRTTLENKVELKNGGTMIPLGVIAKILRQTYDFDKDSGVVIVDEDKNPNIALNKTAVASTTYASAGTQTFVAANAFDGNMETRWSSQYSDPQWLSVDLGQQKYIGKIKLYWEAAYAKTYSIQLSKDNITWTGDVYVTTTGDGGTDEITLPAIAEQYRYVRIMGLQRATVYGYSLYEVEVFEGTAPVVLTGTLTSTPAAISGAVNLTAEGTADWANWGFGGAAIMNHKAVVTPVISNYAKIGTAEPIWITGNPVMYSWTDGTPVTNASNSIINGYMTGVGNGFQFTVPADTTLKTLKVYVSAMAAKGKLEVSLSDGSAAVYTGYVDSASLPYCKVFTIGYKALTIGQVLTVKYTVDNTYSSEGGISLQAAALK